MIDRYPSDCQNPISFHATRQLRWQWIALATILLFVAVVRIRLLQIPLERDEGEYAYMGQLMLEGIPPYQLAYNMKLPGIYAAYALIMSVFGQSIAGIHLGLMLVNTAAVILLFLLTKKLFGDTAAVVSAASYALLSLSPMVMGTSAHATQFIVPLALGSILLLLNALDSDRYACLFACGLCLGLAFLMKQHAIFFIAFALAYFVWNRTKVRPAATKRLAHGIALLAISSAIPFAFSCGLLYASGTFASFWFWTYSYGAQYVSEISIHDALHNLMRLLSRFVDPWGWIGIMSGVGLSAIFWNRTARKHWSFLAGMTIFSFLTMCPGFYFRGHYAVTFLPVIGILAGVAADSMMQFLSRRKVGIATKMLPALLTIAFMVYPIIRLRFFFFTATPAQASRMMYGTCPFPESLEIARYIKEHTSSRDTIAILGSEPQICFYANRKSATGYIYIYALAEPQAYASKMQKDMICEIERAYPKYAVIVNSTNSWGPRQDLGKPILKWANGYLERNYHVTGIVDIFEDGSHEIHWNDAARKTKSHAQSNVYVFERNRS